MFNMTPNEFNDLLAESERWADSNNDAPRAIITASTRGRLTLTVRLVSRCRLRAAQVAGSATRGRTGAVRAVVGGNLHGPHDARLSRTPIRPFRQAIHQTLLAV